MTFMPIGETGRTLAEENPCADGSRLGKTDVVTKPQNSSEIAAWLAGHSPADMDKAAESRALSHGVSLEVKYEGRYPRGENGEILPSYMVAVGCKIVGGDASRKAALDDLVKFQTPAPIRQIERWLAELSVLTAGRSVDDVSAELLVTAYSSRLSQYPADVVRHALLKHSWKWFPSWAEMEKVCKAKAGPRQHMIAALSTPVPDQEPTRRPPTQEERDRIAALIAEQFPNVPSGWRDRALDEVTKGDCIRDDGGDA